MFWQLLFVVAVVGVAWYRWSRRRLYRLAEEIPCPLKSYPVIGIAHMFIGSSQDRMKTLQIIGRETNQQGGLLSAWLGNQLFISMTDPAAIDVVSKTCLDKDEFTMKFTRTAIGNGLSSAPASGATLVKGTSVGLHIWGAHRNPSYWEDADQFRPERFLEGPLSHPVQFIPFSYSMRGCIGSTYAMLFVKTTLATLLRRYRLLPPAGAVLPLPVKFDIMMKAVDGFLLRIEERNKNI